MPKMTHDLDTDLAALRQRIVTTIVALNDDTLGVLSDEQAAAAGAPPGGENLDPEAEQEAIAHLTNDITDVVFDVVQSLRRIADQLTVGRTELAHIDTTLRGGHHD